MSKNNGFTLIELLAVIVILAVIALIATPLVLNTISDSKKESELLTADNYINAVDQNIVIQGVNGDNALNGIYFIRNGDLYDTDNNKVLEVTMDGIYPKTGTLTFENNIVIAAEIEIDEYTIICDIDGCRASATDDANKPHAIMIVVDKSSGVDNYSPIILDEDLLNDVKSKYPELFGLEFPKLFYHTEEDEDEKKLTVVDNVLEIAGINDAKIKQAIYDCYHVRAWFQRKAVITLLDDYTKNISEGSTRYVSLIGTYNKAQINFGWTAIDSNWKSDDTPATNTRKNNASVADWIMDYGTYDAEFWTNSEVENPLYTYANGSGSNLEASYVLAANNMQSDSISEVPETNRHVILFTDGKPSYKIGSNDRTSLSVIKGTSSSVYSDTEFNAIESIVKDKTYNVSVICYGNDTLENTIYGQINGKTRFADRFYNISDDFSKMISMINKLY